MFEGKQYNTYSFKADQNHWPSYFVLGSMFYACTSPMIIQSSHLESCTLIAAYCYVFGRETMGIITLKAWLHFFGKFLCFFLSDLVNFLLVAYF